MNRKLMNAACVLVTVVTVTLLADSAFAQEDGEENPPEKQNILFLVGTISPLSTSDQQIYDRLVAQGGVVTLGNSTAAVSAADNQDLVVISDSVDGDYLDTGFIDVPAPIMLMNQNSQDDFQMSTSDHGWSAFSDIAMVSGSALAAGLTGTVTATTTSTNGGWGKPPSTVTEIGATLTTDSTRKAIYGFDRGALLADSTAAVGARVFFFKRDSSVLTTNGWTLFDSALNWVMATRPTKLSGLTVNDTANAADWSLQGDLQEGALAYGDRTYTFNDIPDEFTGMSWIKAANDSKSYSSNPLFSFTLGHAADVYVAMDERFVPTWVDSSWENTGFSLSVNALELRTYYVYKKAFSAGTVTLDSYNGNNYSMYIVMIGN